jgi:hypothetical protein
LPLDLLSPWQALSLLFRQSIAPIISQLSVGSVDHRNKSGDDKMGPPSDDKFFPSPLAGEGG